MRSLQEGRSAGWGDELLRASWAEGWRGVGEGSGVAPVKIETPRPRFFTS